MVSSVGVPATTWKQLSNHAWLEIKLMLRNAEQVLLAIVIPALLLIFGKRYLGKLAVSANNPQFNAIDYLTPGVLALAVMSTAFTAIAIATGFERRYLILKRLGVSPLSRTKLLIGKAMAVFTIQSFQLVVLVAVAFWLGWQPKFSFSSGAYLVLLWFLATVAFVGLGLFLAGTLKAEVTLAVANLVYLLLLIGGGLLIPSTTTLQWLPSAGLGNGFRAAFWQNEQPWLPIFVLICWAIVAWLLNRRFFKWE